MAKYKLANISREDLVQQLEQRVKKKRFKHILRVEATAIKLAGQYGVDPEAASLAALLHDYAKEDSFDQVLVFAGHPGFDAAWQDYGSEIWHGPLAALIAQRDFEVSDMAVLQAVWGHTIGSRAMTDLAKVIYIADYIEPGRDFPGVDQARRLADQDLDQAVTFKMKRTLSHLIDQGQTIYPETLTVYNDWIATLDKEN
ncbi:phosphohydrolase [Aerococcus urinaehominis]|uniref:bis(5'-nucleosyl)-tetraphosphatase (symmetrical) n=1 Tax=Aerococcus urinaehominis TaxID=128944 RepID=A0A0X8FLQ9_9LACT|nr:bis(5'-nucleosyl)-tetraphosphatase (symmetrical) YqeK [Aerococcus urinaehominis]AMB99648.1 phosphohydrolase [Aerococcus urinaehominis]SDL88878.1 putative HD superfamily hydrolase of NAD metabolism [Aerococcus urinaehominis]